MIDKSVRAKRKRDLQDDVDAGTGTSPTEDARLRQDAIPERVGSPEASFGAYGGLPQRATHHKLTLDDVASIDDPLERGVEATLLTLQDHVRGGIPFTRSELDAMRKQLLESERARGGNKRPQEPQRAKSIAERDNDFWNDPAELKAVGKLVRPKL